MHLCMILDFVACQQQQKNRILFWYLLIFDKILAFSFIQTGCKCFRWVTLPNAPRECVTNAIITIEVKHHVYVKRKTRICTTWPSFLFTCRLLFIISTPKLVVSRNFLSIRFVLCCFYPLWFSILRNSQLESDSLISALCTLCSKVFSVSKWGYSILPSLFPLICF